MAGYLFSLDSVESLELYATNGVYSTKISEPTGHWKKHHEATFCDYATMKDGDNVYFFIDRKIYGIGQLINITNDCKFCNFPGASAPNVANYLDIKEQLLWDEGENDKKQRWVCFFRPSPYFFRNGVDMDEVLTSNPNAFKMLRTFWKLSFIKFDEEENQAFKDIILKFNQNLLGVPEGVNIFPDNHESLHAITSQKLQENNYELEVAQILISCADGQKLKHEMAIEAGLLSQLSNGDEDTIRVFGAWDYLSHQVVASPFKPIDYMDKMDVFGYSYIMGFEPTKSKYLVAELKKGAVSNEDIDQLLKYVDWIREEYCYGDYSMIEAFLVGSSFSNRVREHKENVGIRKYTVGRRPAQSLEWSNLKLARYEFNENNQRLDFEVIR